MSTIAARIIIEDATADPLGTKEAMAMALEPLGSVRVLEIMYHEPKQLRLGEAGPARPAAPPGQAGGATPEKQASAEHVPVPPKQKRSMPMASCLNCGGYCKSYGQDEQGRLYWGICWRTGRPVYELSGRCGNWARAPQT